MTAKQTKFDSLGESKTILMLNDQAGVDAAKAWGFSAALNPHPDGQWPVSDTKYFREKNIRLFTDVSDSGNLRAQCTAISLFPDAKSVKLIGLPGGKSLEEWRKNGGTRESLLGLMKATPALTAEKIGLWRAPRNPGRNFQLTPLGELMSEVPESVTYTVDGLLPASGISMIAAKPKVGKSTLARVLGLSVSRGESFLGRTTVRGPVIYLALEEKRDEVRKHFETLGADGSEQIFVHCNVAPQNPMPELMDLVQKIQPALVIIDPILRMVRIRDTNDYAQVTQALEPLVSLARDLRTHVLMVHHSGKNERSEATDGIIGSTAFFAAVDTAMIMKRSDHRRTIQTEQRYGTNLPETTVEFDADRRSVSLGVLREEADSDRVAQEMLDYLGKAASGKTEQEIDSAVKSRTELKRSALRSLLAQGKVARTGTGKRGNPYTYAICSDSCPHDTQGTMEQESPHEQIDEFSSYGVTDKRLAAREALKSLLRRQVNLQKTKASMR